MRGVVRWSLRGQFGVAGRGEPSPQIFEDVERQAADQSDNRHLPDERQGGDEIHICVCERKKKRRRKDLITTVLQTIRLTSCKALAFQSIVRILTVSRQRLDISTRLCKSRFLSKLPS